MTHRGRGRSRHRWVKNMTINWFGPRMDDLTHLPLPRRGDVGGWWRWDAIEGNWSDGEGSPSTTAPSVSWRTALSLPERRDWDFTLSA